MEIGSDEYYATIDKTIREHFPKHFKDEKPKAPSTVVAPATRSVSPNKVKLTQSQVQIAKRLGITPEQYARELIKLESR